MTDKFESGSIVKLKSGGPAMTVRAVSTDGETVFCQWFAGSKLNDGSFAIESIIEAKKENE